MNKYQEFPFDWNKIFEETINIFKQYLRINTTNPPGNETPAALFFKEIFEKEGIECSIYEKEPGRGNIVAVLKGSGEKKLIVLMNHLDVVPVDLDRWNFPPFEAAEADGFIYARGAQDMKSFGILQLMTMLLLKRSGMKINRDLVFLGCADEEKGGFLGSSFMIEKLPWLDEAAFCINEGGGIWKTSLGNLIYKVAFSEKIPSQFQIKAEGVSGHGSVPHKDNCNVKLVSALERLNQWKSPIEVIPIVRTFLTTLGQSEEEPLKSILTNVDDALMDPKNLELLETEFPIYNALIRDTISLNIIQSGSKVNVIPSTGHAIYDARILPGHTRQEFIEKIRSVLKDLPVTAELFEANRPVPAEIIESEDSEFYKAVKNAAARWHPGAAITPSIMTGASDSQYFRVLGVPAYGFAPLVTDEVEKSRVHGHNERMSIENLKSGTRIMFDIMAGLVGNVMSE